MTKKKKNPGGILEWIIDFFVSPIANAIKGLIATLTKQAESVPMEEVETKAKALITPVQTEFEKLGTSKSLVTPEEANKKYLEFVKMVDTQYPLLATLYTTASIASVGFAEELWRELMYRPDVKAQLSEYAKLRDSVVEIGTNIPFRQHLFSVFQPMIPDPDRLAQMATKELLSVLEYLDTMSQNGFNAEWANLLWENAFIHPSPEVVLELLRRGIIKEWEFHRWLRLTGYTVRARNSILQLKDVIPPLPDLIRFAVREALGTHKPEEQYPEYKQWAAKMGLSEYWAGAYWYAHWERIGLSQMYDNLYRGYWDKEKFLAMLKIKDVHPDDREDILKVAYTVPSIREMGYGFDTGEYTINDITRFRAWGGLSPEDAKRAGRSMVAYRTEAEREAVRREFLHMFALGKISEDDFKKELTRLTTAKEAVDLWVERGKLQAARKQKPLIPLAPRIVTATDAKWMFVNGLRKEEWYKAKLIDLEWDEERIKVAVERAKHEMIPPPEVVEDIKFRNLTVTQIRNLWELGKISDGEVSGFLQAIGYSPEHAAMLAQSIMYTIFDEFKPLTLTRTDIARMYDMGVYTSNDMVNEFIGLGYSPGDAELLGLYYRVNIMFPDLKAMYSKGWITSGEMYQALLDLKLPEERAKVLMATVIKATQPERVEKERDLTKSEIVKGVKKGIITQTGAIALLMDLGYEEWEARYILAINITVEAGDPESYWEMRRITEAYKKAMGKPSKEVPDTLLVWEQRVKDKKAEIEKLRAEEVSEAELSKHLVELSTLEAGYRRVIQQFEKAEV